MPPNREKLAFYNKRGTCEQWIKEGKGAIKWTRLSCRTFAANAVRLQLHALAYNLGNFLRTLATPEPIKRRLIITLPDRFYTPTLIRHILWPVLPKVTADPAVSGSTLHIDGAAPPSPGGATARQHPGSSNASAQPPTSDQSVDADASTRCKYGAKAEFCMASSCGPLASTDGRSVGFSTRRDDPSNREFSSIDNDR